MKHNDYCDMAKNFLLFEGSSPEGISAWLQALEESVNALTPKTLTDQRRLVVIKDHIKLVKKHCRKLQEKISVLEEKISVLEEEDEK